MAWPSSTASDAQYLFQRLFVPRVTRTLLYRFPLWKLFNSEVSRLQEIRGEDYAQLAYHQGVQATMAPRGETADVEMPGTFSTANARVYKQEIMGGVGWTQQQEEDYKDGAVLTNWFNDLTSSFIDGWTWAFQALAGGDGTGRMGRLASYNAGTRVVTLDNTQADFGWDGCTMIRDNMLVDIFTVADITRAAAGAAWGRAAQNCVVDQTNRVGKTFRITARTNVTGSAIGADANPADGDFVFVHGAAELSAAHKLVDFRVPIGLHGMVDDGADAGNEFDAGTTHNGSYFGKTIQNVDRTGFAPYKARIWSAADFAGVKGTAQPFKWSDIQEVLRWTLEESDAGDPARLHAMANGATVDWMGYVSNLATGGLKLLDSKNTELTPGYKVSNYLIAPTGAQIPVHRIPMMSDGVIQFVNFEDIHKWDVVPVRNWPYNPGGGVQFASPGSRNLTYEQWWRWRGAWWAFRMDRCARVQDIDISY